MSSNKWFASVVKNINLDISSNSSTDNLSFKAAKESMNNLILKWSLANSAASFKLRSYEASIDTSTYLNNESKFSNWKPPTKKKIDADYSKYLAPWKSKPSGWKQTQRKCKLSTDRQVSNKAKCKIFNTMQTSSRSNNRCSKIADLASCEQR